MPAQVDLPEGAKLLWVGELGFAYRYRHETFVRYASTDGNVPVEDVAAEYRTARGVAGDDL